MQTTPPPGRALRRGYAGVVVLLVGWLVTQAWLSAPEWSPAVAPDPAAERAEGRRLADLHREASLGAVTGLVRTPDGAGVPGVEVRIDRFGVSSPEGLQAARTDSAGRFTFRRLPVRWYQVDVYDDGQVAPSDTAERATKVVGGSTVEAADLVVGRPSP
ncbi:carboxypeptidase-like regulatory domain-containing protein [Nocardioides campestrisoli]|uniref:carboxypeptidase-like regulatory domain-containing protein n=1 Tax=Nocardioides campestrisoli TaxID=2736757 RepID=UPI0015E6D987|nr:carboxypeptidase-like regulatory domain-containing protein [Nocardioides campestrisoli]